MLGLAQLKLANATRLRTPHVNRFRSDRLQGYVDGYMGEWAVADSLGVERPCDTSGRADEGWDLACGDLTVQVRSTPHRTGRMMFLVSKPLSADVAVLVVGTNTPNTVRIVGGITRWEFGDDAHLRDFGHGPTRYLEQVELQPWRELRGRLLRLALVSA